jgi:hypothetical protein
MAATAKAAKEAKEAKASQVTEANPIPPAAVNDTAIDSPEAVAGGSSS